MPDPPADPPTPRGERPRPRRRRRRAKLTATENPMEVRVFWALSIACFVSMTLYTVLTFFDKNAALPGYIATLTIGAIGGRLSGRANNPDQVEALEKK